MKLRTSDSAAARARRSQRSSKLVQWHGTAGDGPLNQFPTKTTLIKWHQTSSHKPSACIVHSLHFNSRPSTQSTLFRIRDCYFQESFEIIVRNEVYINMISKEKKIRSKALDADERREIILVWIIISENKSNTSSILLLVP